MFKFFHLYFHIIFLVITSVSNKEYKLPSDVVEKLWRKSTDENYYGGIAVKKQLFQDIFMEDQKNNKLQFGYVCENPIQWEQRFEEKDLSNNRHRGKVTWGDMDGNYGEHYWDINHK
ncbi:uncharacterized protein LOC122714561 [Apis laboriosa]|uniref:uncharacterized protein LOC122714561 n=1 Tax=Apis laboriosa TaxID=183418 RepID=UPI001CC7FDA8|nr:uncharacterized protein LOC122714561 [Apis laboriosa]